MFTFPNPSYAGFALMALPFNPDVTIYSNGPVPDDEPTQLALRKVLAAGVKLDERPVKRLVNNGEGPANGITVEFESGPPAKLGMLLHRPPTRSRAHELIEQLGLQTKPNGDVQTDPMMLQSSVSGCLVAGDTQGSIKQAVVAAADGEYFMAHGPFDAGLMLTLLCLQVFVLAPWCHSSFLMRKETERWLKRRRQKRRVCNALSAKVEALERKSKSVSNCLCSPMGGGTLILSRTRSDRRSNRSRSLLSCHPTYCCNLLSTVIP